MLPQNTKSNCLFCKIIAKEIPSYILYEDTNIIAFLDILPVNLGHTLILPKKHIDTLLEMDNSTIDSIFTAARGIADSIIKAVGAQGFNILVNNKKAAGQLIDHAHIHIIPRFEGDGYEHWHGKKIPEQEMQEIANKIKTILK